MRIIVTGGGTGGHVFPALQIARELKELNKHVDIIFVGNPHSIEEKLAKDAHLCFIPISSKKVLGQGFFKKIIAFMYLKLAILKALWILIKLRPKAVIGVGGYISVPMVVASFCLGIKRYICEQNVVPGLANKYLSLIATKVFISFAESKKFFKGNQVYCVGNPVRKEFFNVPDKEAKSSLRILVTGGSLGAGFLNRQIPYAMKEILSLDKNLEITHQTGEAMQDEVNKLYESLHLPKKAVAFIKDMPQAFLGHDLLISRAGATVCAEIMAAGMPSILVPYPFAQGHQKFNALALEKEGAAIMIEEGEDFKNRLVQALKNLYSEPQARLKMAHNAKALACPTAATQIARSVLNDL